MRASRILLAFVSEENPAQHWVAETGLPLAADGGCDIVNLGFDVAADRIEGVGCNGVA